MLYRLIAEITPRGELVYHQAVLRIEDNAIIPFDPANSDYQQYLAWLAEDNTPKEWNGE
jgi:hypothetical protein